MTQAYTLGRILGVPLRVQPMLVWFLLLLIGWQLMRFGLGAALDMTLGLALLSVLVLWHELGHALVARRFGVHVLDITLWPLGGMARLGNLPENPRIESWIAAAGPLANLAAGLLALPCALLAGLLPLNLWPLSLATEFLWKFVFFNAFLGVTNLIPAFPMDGGRILRAQLARSSTWLKATERAVRVTRVIAALVMGMGMFWNSLFLVLGAFLWWASWQELRQVRARHDPARNTIFDLFQSFVRSRQSAAAPPPSGSWNNANSPASAEGTDFAGPRNADFELHPLPKRGFSDDDIARLERWRGRLPREYPAAPKNNIAPEPPPPR